MTHPEISKMTQLYNDGIGTNTIAKVLNKHRSTIQKWLMRSNIPLRKASPRHKYNINFFSHYTPESCYWAGFIMADGCIRETTLHIKLANKDREHLQKFLNAIQSDYPINGTIYSTVDISGQWFLSDLKNNFGIIPRKTFVTKFPNIPVNMRPHFIRGLIDGDGSICLTSCPTLSLVGTTELLTEISSIFSTLGVKLKSGNLTPPIQVKNKNIGHMSYSGKNAKLILTWLYANSTPSTRLDRKYKRFISLFESIK